MTAQAFIITRGEAARTVTEVLRRRLGLSWSQARRLIADRRVRLAGQTCADPARRVKPGQRLEVVPESRRGERPAPPSRKTGPEPAIRYADDQVIVVDKPAGLTTMRH